MVSGRACTSAGRREASETFIHIHGHLWHRQTKYFSRECAVGRQGCGGGRDGGDQKPNVIDARRPLDSGVSLFVSFCLRGQVCVVRT